MDLLLIILVLIIVVLTFLLLKKERVFGINTEDNSEKEKVKIIESKDYRKNLYDLLNCIPEYNLANHINSFYNLCFQ